MGNIALVVYVMWPGIYAAWLRSKSKQEGVSGFSFRGLVHQAAGAMKLGAHHRLFKPTAGMARRRNNDVQEPETRGMSPASDQQGRPAIRMPDMIRGTCLSGESSVGGEDEMRFYGVGRKRSRPEATKQGVNVVDNEMLQ